MYKHLPREQMTHKKPNKPMKSSSISNKKVLKVTSVTEVLLPDRHLVLICRCQKEGIHPSIGSLFQWPVTLTLKNMFLASNLNLPGFYFQQLVVLMSVSSRSKSLLAPNIFSTGRYLYTVIRHYSISCLAS